MTGNWIALTNQPTFNASTMLLLNDGRVMCQESGGVRWWSLSPDIHGSYINGAWQQLAPMAHTRLYYGSAVFADGRVIVTGGEYSDAGKETNSCELYDPVLDQWTTISPPAGWAEVGDGSSVLSPAPGPLGRRWPGAAPRRHGCSCPTRPFWHRVVSVTQPPRNWSWPPTNG